MIARLRRGILHVHWAFPPTTGGVESHLYELARLQAGRGWRVVVITGEELPVSPEYCEVIPTRSLRLDEISAVSASLAQQVAIFADELREIIAARGIRVVHGHNLHHFSPVPATAIEKLRGDCAVAVHHTFHETWPDILTRDPFYRRWDGNYAISRYVQQQCEELLGFRPQLLHLGVDTDRFRSSRLSFSGAGRPIIFHPARLLPWKGVHRSIEALRGVVDAGHDAELMLTDTQRIADWDRQLPEYRARILQLISDLQLGDNVRFVSPSFHDMPDFYDQADIVLYPTIQGEPFGLVPPEAMSCARPVVASRCGGITESVVDGETGWLVAPDDVTELADRMIRLLRDPALARRFGAAGRRRVKAYFSASRYAAALEAQYVASLEGCLGTSSR
jgi:glycosyltransferase involved in cell wall biosynthesis